MSGRSPPKMAAATLLLAAFVIALGYGILLPVLPGLVVRLDPGASQREILWHMGLISAVYAGAALIMTPVWGRFADQITKPYLLILSLILTGAASVAGAYSPDMSTLYLWRFVAGLGAGAAAPSIQVWFSRWETGNQIWRARRIVWTGLASTAGFFVGPFAGGLAAAAAANTGLGSAIQQRLPFLAVGVATILVALALLLAVPEAPVRSEPREASGTLVGRILPFLLPAGIAALATSAFEVTLSSMGAGRQLGAAEIGFLFAQCTLVMFAAQSLLVVPGVRDRSMKPLIIPSLLLLAIGLVVAVFAFGTVSHVLATGLVGIGGGLLPAVLAREISMIDRGAVGSATGLQSAASQAGQTAGAVMSSAIAAFAEPRWVLLAAALSVVTSGLIYFIFGTERKPKQFSNTGV